MVCLPAGQRTPWRPARIHLVLGGLEDVPRGAGAGLGELSGGAEHQILDGDREIVAIMGYIWVLCIYVK